MDFFQACSGSKAIYKVAFPNMFLKLQLNNNLNSQDCCEIQEQLPLGEIAI